MSHNHCNMKNDELFAIKALIQKIDSIKNSLKEPLNDPPDVWMVTNLFQSIGVEITRLNPISTSQDGKFIKPDESLSALIEWGKKIKETLLHLVPMNKTLICYLSYPIPSFKGFKSEFIKSIKAKLLKPNEIQDNQKIELTSWRYELTITHSRASDIRFIFIPYSADTISQVDLTRQATLMLEHVINDKIYKCRKISERLWLLLINMHPVVDFQIFKQVHLENWGDFEKVWIVNSKEEVELLMEKNSSFRRYFWSFVEYFKGKNLNQVP